jgi:hypothetical protein
MKIYKKVFYVTGITLLIGGASLLASDNSAIKILNNAYEYIGNMDRYAFDAVVVDEYRFNDNVKKVRHNVSVKVDRPYKLRVDVEGDTVNRTNYLNNGSFVMTDHDYKYYGQLETPKNIDGALDFILKKYGINAPLTSLVYSDMQKRMKFKTSKNFGKMNVSGVECDYVAFKDGFREAHVWIATGDKPFIKNYSIIDRIDDEYARINTSITWKDSSSVMESDFIFTAPEDVSKISIESAK